MLRLARASRLPSRTLRSTTRLYATVSPFVINNPPPDALQPQAVLPSFLDARILQAVRSKTTTPLSNLIQDYVDNSGRILPHSLLYESRPSATRRVITNDDRNARNIVLLAHCIQDGAEQIVTVSSGFALQSPKNAGETLIVSCAHTFEEIRNSPLCLRLNFPMFQAEKSAPKSGTLVVTGQAGEEVFHPVSAIPSALPRSDLILFSCKGLEQESLPVSPYPVQPQSTVRAHFVAHQCPDEPGWSPWIAGTWSKWVQGTVLGYRDFAGREAQPGTYDSLSHLLFTPLPTAGSSGGPIVDEASGAVVGIMLGTRMDNRVEGVRGWGVPAEGIFEMFSLPGLEGKE